MGFISTAFKPSTTFATNISLFYLYSDDEAKENATEMGWHQEEFRHPEENGYLRANRKQSEHHHKRDSSLQIKFPWQKEKK